MAAELGVSLDGLAIAAALAQPWAWCALSGAVDPDQLASNAAAAELLLPGEVLGGLGTLAEPASSYWTRARRAWT